MIKLKVVTPNGVIYEDDDIVSISMPTNVGVVTIMHDHLPLVSLIEAGEVEIRKNNGQSNLAVSSGILHVEGENSVQILADTAERAEEIDIARAEEAHKRALAYLSEQTTIEEEEYAAMAAKIEKELARINVGRKYRKINIAQ